MAWISLVIAGVCEIVWATGLKYSHGFTRLWPSVITVIGMIVSFYFLAQAVKTLPLGTSYAIWTGIGAIGSVIIGIVVFNDPANFWRFFFLALIMIGIIGLKVTA